MAIFKYKMQNILNIKSKLEEQEKMNFAMMRIKLNEEEEALELLKKRRQELEEEGRRLRLENINVLELKENEASVRYQDECIKAQILKVRTAQKNLEAARVRMQQAMQEREIHEKLREKAFDAFLQEERIREAKEIDELTSYTYGKKEKVDG